jgi:hypothetical protein
MIAYSWTKLLQGQGTSITKYDDSALETASKTGILQLPEGKTAGDVVADYLSRSTNIPSTPFLSRLLKTRSGLHPWSSGSPSRYMV